MSAPSLREFLLRSVDRPQAPRLRISQAGSKCERKVAYQATGAESLPESPEGSMKMALGSALDAYTLAGAPMPVQEDFYARAAVPVSITMGGVTVNGTADIVFGGATAALALVSDLKTVGAKTWAKVQKAPKQEHEAQVNLYAFGLGAPRWSVCYVNADTGEILEHFGATDAFAARRDFGLFEIVALALGRGELPARAFEDFEETDGSISYARDGFECRYCDFVLTCWGEDKRKEEAHELVQEA